MVECFFCGKEGAVFSAIAGEGVVDICEDCSLKENIPILKRPSISQLMEAERRYPSFKERAEKRRKEIEAENLKRWHPDKQNVNLRDIVNKNYRPSISAKENPDLGLTDNFHWIILRARKRRHLTHKQVAEAIQESEATIEMLEKGQLPQDYPKLINKIENFFNIKLIDNENLDKISVKNKFVQETTRQLEFKSDAIKNFTISDLQKIKNQREEAGKKEFSNNWKRDAKEEQEEFDEEEYFD